MIISLIGCIVLFVCLFLFLYPINKISLARTQANTYRDGINKIKKIYEGETLSDDDERISKLVLKEKEYLDELEQYTLLRKKAGIGILIGVALMCLGIPFMGESGGSSKSGHKCAVCGKSENEVNLYYMSEDDKYYCPKHFDKAFDYYYKK